MDEMTDESGDDEFHTDFESSRVDRKFFEDLLSKIENAESKSND